MRKLIVKKIDKVKKLSAIKCIINEFKNVPYSAICKALRNKDIRINGIKISKDVLVEEKDEIEIYLNDNILFNIPLKIDYYYEDDNILIAFKPNSVLSNNEDKKNIVSEPTFEEMVIKDKNNENIKICHRLDRNTSGLVIFSKNDTSYLEILNGFKNGYINKEYIAYVSGCNFSQNHAVLEAYLIKDTKLGYSKISSKNLPHSEKILTEYTVIETNTKLDYSKLSIKLLTGKTHQIRAHLASVNHPIIGDSKYGKNEVNKKFKKNKQCLFAYKYTFSFELNSDLRYLNSKKIILNENITKI